MSPLENPDVLNADALMEDDPSGIATMASVPTTLPPGVHPYDPSVEWDGGELHEPNTIPKDTYGSDYQTGDRQFKTDNGEALGVWERGSHEFTADTIVINASIQVVGRQVGRKNITLSCPATGANGFWFAPTQGEVDMLTGIAVNPGESRTISTEAPVWAGLLAGKTTGTVEVMTETNPSGGSLGSM